jgi:hypothetical protein
LDKLKQVISGAYMQFLRFWKVLFLAYLPILLLFTTLGLVSRASGDITLSYFTRDVVALGDLPFFAGLISQIGGMLWSAALGICLFTLIFLNGQRRNIAAKKFLLGAVILTTILLMDDIFLVHEDIGPDYLHVGEKTIVIAYFLITIYFLFTNRNEILTSDYLILGVALAMFGMSIFLDAADLDDYDRYSFIFTEQFQIFLEDGFKFVGIATWLVYFARYSYQTLSWGVENRTKAVLPQSVQSSQRIH